MALYNTIYKLSYMYTYTPLKVPWNTIYKHSYTYTPLAAFACLFLFPQNWYKLCSCNLKSILFVFCISEENEKKKFICLLIWRQNMREMEGEDEEGRPERRREHQQSPAQFALLDTLSTSTSTSNLPQPALPGSL